MGNKIPATKGDVNGITWRLKSYRRPHSYIPHCGMSSLFLKRCDLSRNADELCLHPFSEYLDGSYGFLKVK